MKRLGIFVLVGLLAVTGWHLGHTADISASYWSQTDASNNSPSPNGAPEGMAPSGVNDTIRANMGAIKRFWDRINGTVASTGSSNAYVLTYSVAPSSYVTGEAFTFKASFANTTTATVNINSLGAKEIKKPSTSGVAALASGDIQSGQVVTVVYDGTQFQLISPVANVATGTVTSVDFAVPSYMAVTGNPITSSGTLTLSFASQSASLFLASPATGSSAPPTFRAITTADIPFGVVGFASAVTTAMTTHTTTVPLDDTRPQSSEGEEILTLPYAAKGTANTLKIDFYLQHDNTNGEVICALFIDTNSDSTVAGGSNNSTTNVIGSTLFQWVLPVATSVTDTSAHTYKVRCGQSGAGTWTANGFASGRKLGGIAQTNMTVTEYR